MNIVFENEILTKFFDCSLEVINGSETKTFRVHKIILANKSGFFEKLFEKEQGDRYTIHVSFSLEAFERYLKFLYTGNTEPRTSANDYIDSFLMYSYLELPSDALHQLIYELIEYVEEQYHVHSRAEECAMICQFLEDHEVLRPEQRENLLERIGYMIGRGNWFDSGVSVEQKAVFITQRQDGKYTDFDPERFKYGNIIFTADCVTQVERDAKSKALPHEKIKDCTFKIFSWPSITTPKSLLPDELERYQKHKKNKAKITSPTSSPNSYQLETWREFERGKVFEKTTGRVYLTIINGFDKPMKFIIHRKDCTELTFPRGVVNYGSNRIEFLYDGAHFKYETDNYNIYKNTLYRFVVHFD